MKQASTVMPPRAARALIEMAAPPDDREYILSDFREVFDERVTADGLPAARRWYWRETLRSLAPLALRRFRAGNEDESLGSAAYWRNMLGDARYALRLARRGPLASFAIVSTMALGIAATTAVFTATNAVLLRPLPFDGSNHVVQLNTIVPSGNAVNAVAYPDAMDFRRAVPDFADVSVFSPTNLTLQHGFDPQQVTAVQVDDAYARVFALRTALGRLLVPTDTVANAEKVVVLSYEFWTREFGGDRSLIGRPIRIDNELATVVGVLEPRAYVYPNGSADLLVPLSIAPTSFRKNRGALWAMAAARMKPSASLAQAARDLASVSARLSKEFPQSNAKLSAALTPLHDAVVGSVKAMLQLLAAAIAGVLLIACVNIANLILGRAQSRSREFAVRSALGGSPTRVRRQVLAESLTLAAVGGALGIALAPLLTRVLVAIYPEALPRVDEIGVDARVLVVALGATIAAGVLSAMPTMRRVARLELGEDLRDGGRAGSASGARRAGSALVVTQVAASVALVFAAGLLARTFFSLQRVRPGFEPRNTVTFQLVPSRARYKSPDDIDRYFAQVLDALRVMPGVRVASSTTMLPFGNCCFLDTFIQEDRGDQGTNNPQAFVSINAPDFERALGIPLLRGRSFTPRDNAAGEHVVMLSEAAAKRMYPGKDPIGQLISWNGRPHWRVIGVVGSTHATSLSDGYAAVLYVPSEQTPSRARYIVIRGETPSAQLITGARAALRAIDPTIPLTDIATMERRVRQSLDAQRFRAALMGILGALALVLATIGIYGVVGYSVNQRTREIGIRMALGQTATEVRRGVIIDALRVASVGVVTGVALALVSGRLLAVFVSGVDTQDRVTLFASSGLLGIVVVAAAYGPARRAARVDPMTALRAE